MSSPVEKARWAHNHETSHCKNCSKKFTLVLRKHHCRACGEIFCNECSKWNVPLPHKGYTDRVRSCEGCASPQIVNVSSVPTVGGEMLISAHNVGTSVDGLIVTVDGKYSKRRTSNVAVIIVRVLFISAFLSYCLLLNHSFSTNTKQDY